MAIHFPLIAQHVPRILTGVGNLTLVQEETQHDLKRAAGSKSPVLDVWGVDADGTQYNMEVQTGSSLDPLRFRYYGSAMDVDALSASREYDKLPERWVVVVLERDPGAIRDARVRERAQYLKRNPEGKLSENRCKGGLGREQRTT